MFGKILNTLLPDEELLQQSGSVAMLKVLHRLCTCNFTKTELCEIQKSCLTESISTADSTEFIKEQI